MRHLTDLINLSEIEFPLEQQGWFRFKILRLIQAIQKIETNAFDEGTVSFSRYVNTHISIDVNELPFAAISMFTVFELIVLIVMSIIFL